MKLSNAIVAWLPLGIAVTAVCLLVNVAIQQNYRQSLNDPQIQIAEDTASALSNGVSADTVIKNFPLIDIAQSLTPWVAIYDEKGTPVQSSGVLDGATPTMPKGIFDAASSGSGKDTAVSGQNRITWQPKPGVRSAIVVQYFTGKSAGFVVAGRNMIEVENRENHLSTIVFFGWLAALFGSLIVQIAIQYVRRA